MIFIAVYVDSAERVDVCQLLKHPRKYAVKMVEVRASVEPTYHGTWLEQKGCDGALLIVLPQQIPDYTGPVRLIEDAEFERYKMGLGTVEGAPRFTGVLIGQFEYKRWGRSFGNEIRRRLVLHAVRDGILTQRPEQ